MIDLTGEMLELKESGWTLEEIGNLFSEKYSMSRSTIYFIHEKYMDEKSQKKRKVYTEEDVKKAEELYACGMTLDEVGEEIGVTGNTISHWFKKHDILVRCPQDYPINKQKIYYNKNKAKFFAKNAKRRAIKLKVMPPWADEEKISGLYTKAQEISHHVDHIIPMQPYEVEILELNYVGVPYRGLHIYANLQIIPAKENLRKHNKHPKDFYGPDWRKIVKKNQEKFEK